MQMLLALAAPAWQLLTEHRCGRPLRQNKVETANNVITQSLQIGVHSLRAAVHSGHCWHRLGSVRDVTGCQEAIISSPAVQDSLNSAELQMNVCELNADERRRHVTAGSGDRKGARRWRRAGSVVWVKGQTCCFTTVLFTSTSFDKQDAETQLEATSMLRLRDKHELKNQQLRSATRRL